MSSLSPLLQKALRSARLKQLPAGQIILYEGVLAQEVFILKSGVVKLHDIDDQGNEKLLHLVRPPAVVPFAFFSGMREPLRWFYATLTDCEVYVLPAMKLQEMTRADGDLAGALTNEFSTDVHQLLIRLSSLGKTNAKDKVIAALQFLVGCHATERRTGWWRVNFPVSHQLIANLCGITRETTAITMKELQVERMVRNPRVTILEINRKSLG
jgi:CRP/FNR family transcriptional regulator, cyclic AMP receptor protein